MIYFPIEYTLLSSPCTSYLLPEDSSYYTKNTQLPCSFNALGNYFTIITVELKGSAYSNHTVMIKNIINPSSGGTGNFKIETRRGILNILDYNHNFETVGIVPNPNTIATASFTRTANTINSIADYTFTVTTISVLPKNGSVLLTWSSGDLIFTTSSSCSTSVSSTVNCVFGSDYKSVKFYVKTRIFYIFIGIL